MNTNLKMALSLLILNLIGIGGFWISADKLLGSIALTLSIAFSAFSIFILKERGDDDLKNSNEKRTHGFTDSFTPQNKIAIFFLGCVIFFIPALYFKSANLAFGATFIIQIFLLLIILKNTYFAFLSYNFMSTPVISMHHEVENTGTLEQRKIQLTVQYSYRIGAKEYQSYRIRYPFWFVTNKQKLLLAKKIKSGAMNTCYVNPNNCHQAVLTKGFEIRDLPWYFIYTFFVLFTLMTYEISN